MSVDLLAELIAVERKVWDALVQGDAAADEALMSEDFLGVYATGFANRACHVGQLADGPSVAFFELSETTAQPLGPDHGLIAYRADFARPDGEAETMFVTSIWRRCEEGWVNMFSQDTQAV